MGFIRRMERDGDFLMGSRRLDRFAGDKSFAPPRPCHQCPEPGTGTPAAGRKPLRFRVEAALAGNVATQWMREPDAMVS